MYKGNDRTAIDFNISAHNLKWRVDFTAMK